MLLLAVSMLVSTARMVTPGIGTLLLSSTTPEIDVFNGSPGARPEAVKLAAVIAIAPSIAQPQEAALRKNLIERLPNLRKIEEVRATPLPGIFEVRYAGNQILYADEKGDFIISGSIIDTRTKIDLTEARIEKLLAVEFDSLPLSDAILIKQGTGARRIAVFVDPNCGYCKRFERDLAQIGDLSIYTFLIPILGADSNVKARDIW